MNNIISITSKSLWDDELVWNDMLEQHYID